VTNYRIPTNYNVIRSRVEEKVKLNREGSVCGLFQIISIQRLRKTLKQHGILYKQNRDRYSNPTLH